MWEAFQGLGALFGIGSAVYLSYQHLVRLTPVAFFVAKDEAGDSHLGRRKRAHLRIINRSERPIFVKWPAGRTPNLIRILPDNTNRSILVSLMRDEVSVCLAGNATHEFDISKPENFGRLDPENQMYTDLTWRFVQPLWYKHDRRIPLIITKSDFDALEDNGEISQPAQW